MCLKSAKPVWPLRCWGKPLLYFIIIRIFLLVHISAFQKTSGVIEIVFDVGCVWCQDLFGENAVHPLFMLNLGWLGMVFHSEGGETDLGTSSPHLASFVLELQQRLPGQRRTSLDAQIHGRVRLWVTVVARDVPHKGQGHPSMGDCQHTNPPSFRRGFSLERALGLLLCVVSHFSSWHLFGIFLALMLLQPQFQGGSAVAKNPVWEDGWSDRGSFMLLVLLNPLWAVFLLCSLSLLNGPKH